MSDEKVVGLRGRIPEGEAVPNVVGLLESLLQRAKAGEIRAVAYAMVQHDASVATGWEKPGGEQAKSMSIESHGLGNAILTLSYRYGAG